ncbi:TIGR02391 family protein [Ralstonia pseudosolanacearum]|uniref:TIGR02391 family protein n=1 Tax=Ralstonia pseudosolanacearum TaxID=1310165 RepID=UPI001C8BF9FC|nr:TIGR02391 family protein [Ralstonia pseudosolanacearum]MBX9430575.1 TIGR02391 family protein [Ralstonia pseudosolanacearum]
MSENVTFSVGQIEAIANALGDTADGLTGAEIGLLLASARIDDIDPGLTKRKRLFNAFANCQNRLGHRRNLLAFIRFAMKPERYVGKPERFEPMRANLNRGLAFAGLQVEESGELVAAERASTLPDAIRRANELRTDLAARGVHADVLAFCRAELVADNYFHAVLEATKSIAAKLRDKTGLTDDGAALVDRALGGNSPMLAINPLADESQQSEQRGFANLVKGVFGMFRNTTAHAPRMLWNMTKSDAEDLLTLASLIHRRLDAAVRPVTAQEKS